MSGKLLSCALLALTDFALPAQSLNVAAVGAAIDAAHATGDFTGVVVLTQHGKVLLTRAVGEGDRTTHAPLRTTSVFRLASLTKQVTSLLVMQQVVAGKMRLDEKAGEVLPALSTTTGRVTVQQLLQHVSGLPNPSAGWSERQVPLFYTRTDVRADYLQSTATGFCSGKPVREPDEKFEYNNCDYIVLGALLEKVTGKPFAQLVKTQVSGPLGLKSWGIFLGGNMPATVSSYAANGDREAPQNPATYGSAGALYGDALDVARWDTALLTYKLLPKAATGQMFHGENNLGGEALGSWSYDLPSTQPAVHLVERQGDMGATRLLNLLLPDFDASLVILANTERADLFNTYSKVGLGYALVKAATGR